MYANPATFQTDQTLLTDRTEALRELSYQIDRLIIQRTENLAIRFPILGLVMDMNDLGLMSGITLFVLMYIFLLVLTREEENVNRAKDKAMQSNNKDDLELLLMVQVFSAPYKAKTGVNPVFYVFFAIPSILQYLILRTDLYYPASRQAGKVLMGVRGFYIQMGAESLLFIGIAVLAVLNGLRWRQINTALNSIREAYEGKQPAPNESSVPDSPQPVIAAQSSEPLISKSGIESSPPTPPNKPHQDHSPSKESKK
jgi:hypothetical protein